MPRNHSPSYTAAGKRTTNGRIVDVTASSYTLDLQATAWPLTALIWSETGLVEQHLVPAVNHAKGPIAPEPMMRPSARWMLVSCNLVSKDNRSTVPSGGIVTDHAGYSASEEWS